MLEGSEVAKAVTSASAVGAIPSAWTLHKHRRWLETHRRPASALSPPAGGRSLHENIVMRDGAVTAAPVTDFEVKMPPRSINHRRRRTLDSQAEEDPAVKFGPPIAFTVR